MGGKTEGEGFSASERAAMKERARELKAERNRADGEATLLAKIEEMTGSDKTIASGIHKIVGKVAPGLQPKTWYGMPAWARDGKVVLFFQSAAKFDSRYATLGFNDPARLDDGNMWATAFAIRKLGPAEKDRVTELVKRASGSGASELREDVDGREDR